ncbi:MAG TPA: hypothetical protein VFE32_17020 [Puia sp.]|nr:hypothetical protein [Puia sp.]
MKRALIIFACSFLSAAGLTQNLLPSQDLLPPHDLPIDLRPTAENPLLFNGWVKATVVWHNPLLRNDTSLWFDFDKASQRLVVTKDKVTAFLFNKREFRSVTFYSGNSTFTFEHVPAINDKDIFYAMVRKDGGYSLYKSIRSEAARGGYEDSYVYYVLFPFPDARVLRLKVLDRRLLDHAFNLSGDKQKIGRYYALHPNEEQDEHFLKGLIEYLNG